jgi:hypothetical protein
MSTRLVRCALSALFFAGLLIFLSSARAQESFPTPEALYPPSYDYSALNDCTSCHFIDGSLGDFMPEAVGVIWDNTRNAFAFSGGGWLASRHSQSNYKSTQNTYCAKCHSPMQATKEAKWTVGLNQNSQPIPDGKVEAVTCASCHPPDDAVIAVLGRELAIYLFGDVHDPASFQVIREGKEDLLCLNCHTTRHNEGNAAFDLMYVAGVRCIDCHMANYGTFVTSGAPVQRRFHDFKVAKNLPYSCGVDGSIIHCHPGFSVESTNAFIPYMKDQHRTMWVPEKATKKLRSAADYLRLWKTLEAQVQK